MKTTKLYDGWSVPELARLAVLALAICGDCTTSAAEKGFGLPGIKNLGERLRVPEKVRNPKPAEWFGRKAQTEQEERNHWKQAQVDVCEREAKKRLDTAKWKKDQVINKLQYAAILQAAGKYEQSNQVFDEAEEEIRRY